MLSAVERKQRWAFFHSKRWDVFDLFSLRASSWFRPRIVKTHVQEARDAALPAPLPTRNGEVRRRLRLVEQQLRSPFFEQQMFTDNEQCVIGVSSIGVFFLHCTRDILSACIQKRFSIYGCNCITWWSYFGLNVNSILTSQMKRTLRSSRFMGQIYICFLNTPHTNSSYRCFRSLNTLISLNMSSPIYLYTLDIQID